MSPPSRKIVNLGGSHSSKTFFSVTIFVIFWEFWCLLGNRKLNFLVFFSKNSEKACLPVNQISPDLWKNDHFLVILVIFGHLIVCKTDLHKNLIISVPLHTLVFLSRKWLFSEKTWNFCLPVSKIFPQKYKSLFLDWMLNFKEKPLFYHVFLSAKLRSWFE